MARKITMFELHFDGVHFGGAGDDSAPEPAIDTEDYEAEEASADEGGRSVGKLVLGMVLTSVVVSVVASRLAKRFAGEDDGADVELEEVDETAEAPVQ